MTPAEAPPELAVAGWRITLLEGDALYAPLRWVLPHAGESESAWLPCHVLICRRDDVTLLVDCGLGVFDDAFEDIPTRATELRDLLAAAGCAPDEITAVALTHFDPDHSGGVVSGSYPDALEPTFPKANVFVLDAALELAEGRGEARAEHAEKLVSALRRHGVEVTGLANGAQIREGARLLAAPGHRAGHACLELTGRGERFVFLADALHAREHVEHPEWDSLNDSDPDVALATRCELIADLAGTGTVVACSHVGSFGRVERSAGGTAVWIDLP